MAKRGKRNTGPGCFILIGIPFILAIAAYHGISDAIERRQQRRRRQQEQQSQKDGEQV